MPATRLPSIMIEKPWGRRSLGHGFGDVPAGGEPVGEVWFEAPDGDEAGLMVKYLFTSERLSVQVHPDDAQACAAGYKHGKEEAWIILGAEADATIAIGPKAPLTAEQLRSAALDGSILGLLDWKPVRAGDVIYLKAGTIHAIGAGITLVEVQQNIDLTYRLFDYGRPRPLHLDESVAVARLEPVTVGPVAGEGVVVEGGKFVVERWRWGGAQRLTLPESKPGWLVPLGGSGTIDGQPWQAGECWLVTEAVQLSVMPGSELLFAYEGPIPFTGLLAG